jgi:hypothetical protein
MRDEDRKAGFEHFMKGVDGLLADEKLREVLLELDADGEEAASLLEPDVAAFLRQRGVRIPEDFRISVTQEAAARPKGQQTQTVCYCLEICWWRWCVRICVCRTRTVLT